jgi:hypothetical protein
LAGAVAAGGLASRDVLRVTGLPLRAPNEDEVARMADEARHGTGPVEGTAYELFPELPPPGAGATG